MTLSELLLHPKVKGKLRLYRDKIHLHVHKSNTSTFQVYQHSPIALQYEQPQVLEPLRIFDILNANLKFVQVWYSKSDWSFDPSHSVSKNRSMRLQKDKIHPLKFKMAQFCNIRKLLWRSLKFLTWILFLVWFQVCHNQLYGHLIFKSLEGRHFLKPLKGKSAELQNCFFDECKQFTLHLAEFGQVKICLIV